MAYTPVLLGDFFVLRVRRAALRATKDWSRIEQITDTARTDGLLRVNLQSVESRTEITVCGLFRSS